MKRLLRIKKPRGRRRRKTKSEIKRRSMLIRRMLRKHLTRLPIERAFVKARKKNPARLTNMTFFDLHTVVARRMTKKHPISLQRERVTEKATRRLLVIQTNMTVFGLHTVSRKMTRNHLTRLPRRRAFGKAREALLLVIPTNTVSRRTIRKHQIHLTTKKFCVIAQEILVTQVTNAQRKLPPQLQVTTEKRSRRMLIMIMMERNGHDQRLVLERTIEMETKGVKTINVHQLTIPLLEIRRREMTRNRQRKLFQVQVPVPVQVMISLKMFLSIALTSIAKILSRGAPVLQPCHPEGRAWIRQGDLVFPV